MTKTNDLLFEILTEELPPKNLENLSLAFIEAVKKSLQAAHLDEHPTIQPFATPRRLAFIIKALPFEQPSQNIERRGPSLEQAFDSQGKPTKACLGFARSCQTTVDKLQKEKTDKGTWLIFKKTGPGKTIYELMPPIIEEALKKLPIKRPMRWGNHSVQFVRPIHSVIMLYGSKIVPAEILGFKTGNQTQGHRFHCTKTLTIKNACDYETVLEKEGHVIPDFEKRERKIRDQIIKQAEKNSAVWKKDNFGVPELLNEVTALVEWPIVLVGSFPEVFLNLPPEVLISVISLHQKSFYLTNELSIINKFIIISNIESKDKQQVIKGNERVMNARLSDAEFFYQEDLKKSLQEWGENLDHVVFQTQLGTLADKTKRISTLSVYLAKKDKADEALAKRAALLSKCDLMTNMVGEFPELQGIMGSYYLLKKEPKEKEIAQAIYAQYIPTNAIGPHWEQDETDQILMIADRLDTIVGIFGINKMPTGEKDPFGLRRAAFGILKTIIFYKLPYNLLDLLKQAYITYSGFNLPNKNCVEQAYEFILERLKSWSLEKGYTTNEFMAVAANQIQNPYDFSLRLEAVKQFGQRPEAESLASANKRVKNILSKYAMALVSKPLVGKLFEKQAEIKLAKLVMDKSKSCEKLLEQKEYAELLSSLADLKEPIDNFFNDVMVMVDDEKVRNNRLILLSKLFNLFSQVADISLLHME